MGFEWHLQPVPGGWRVNIRFANALNVSAFSGKALRRREMLSSVLAGDSGRLKG